MESIKKFISQGLDFSGEESGTEYRKDCLIYFVGLWLGANISKIVFKSIYFIIPGNIFGAIFLAVNVPMFVVWEILMAAATIRRLNVVRRRKGWVVLALLGPACAIPFLVLGKADDEEDM